MAERLALPTSDHGVVGSNPAGGENLPEPKRRLIAQSLSCSPFHRLEMSEILLKGRKTLTHPSIFPPFPVFRCPQGISKPHSRPWCYLPISPSVFLSFLFLSLSPAELSSPCQRILRCGHTIRVSVSLPWLGDHAHQLHSGFCCEPPRSSHGLCRKCSEVSYIISSQGLGSFSRFLLSRSSSHRHKGRWIRWASA